jgi:DNA damage-binding protein 1
MSQFNCEPDEETTAVENLSMDASPPLFCVGTFYYHVSEHEPTDGRLLIFSLKGQPSGRSSQLSLIASAHVQGCIYALAIINGLIAVAVNASVRGYHCRYPALN